MRGTMRTRTAARVSARAKDHGIVRRLFRLPAALEARQAREERKRRERYERWMREWEANKTPGDRRFGDFLEDPITGRRSLIRAHTVSSLTGVAVEALAEAPELAKYRFDFGMSADGRRLVFFRQAPLFRWLKREAVKA